MKLLEDEKQQEPFYKLEARATKPKKNRSLKGSRQRGCLEGSKGIMIWNGCRWKWWKQMGACHESNQTWPTHFSQIFCFQPIINCPNGFKTRFKTHKPIVSRSCFCRPHIKLIRSGPWASKFPHVSTHTSFGTQFWSQFIDHNVSMYSGRSLYYILFYIFQYQFYMKNILLIYSFRLFN